MHLKPEMPASMSTKLLRGEKDYEREYRGGVRGGKDLFNFEDLRLMSYKDRECYLGGTSKIGYLDKGGKWKKGDWYKNVDRPVAKDSSKLSEMKRLDDERMEIALGIRKKPETSKDKEVPILAKKQAEQFTKKIKEFGNNEFNGSYGLGYKTDTSKLNSTKKNPHDFTQNNYRLEGIGSVEVPKVPNSARKDFK